MHFKQFSLLFASFCISIFLMGQAKQKVTIVADISNYSDTLPVSNHKEWQGRDTLVPFVINAQASKDNIMGAEYLVFPSRLDGDSLSPNNEALRGRDRKIWRTMASINNKIYTWTFEVEKPIEIDNRSLLGGTHLVYPGDSIHVSYKEGSYIFSGRGAERFRIVDEIKKARESVVMQDKKGYPLDIERFLKRNQYLDEQITKTMQILEANRSKLSPYEYNWIKGQTLVVTEPHRLYYFHLIANPALEKYQNQSFPYTPDDLVRVWDSTMYKPVALWWRSSEAQNINGIIKTGQIKGFYDKEVWSKLNFRDYGYNDTIDNIPAYKKLMYHKMKAAHTGLFRERLLCYYINEEITQEIGAYSWFAQSILRDYYATPGFPAYKQWMRAWEAEHQGMNRANGVIPLFYLVDKQGKPFTHRNSKGKFAVVNFWYSGCEPCKEQAATIAQVMEKTKGDTNIIYLNVSVDINQKQWEKSIQEGKYVPKGGIQLWTGGQGKNHEMIKDFDVVSFPTVRMFDAEEKIVIDKVSPYATTFSSAHLLAMATRKTPSYQDGPYVFYEQGKMKALHVNNNKVDELKSTARLSALTESYDRQFHFSLQKKIEVQPSVYPAPSKMLVISDIEGNFAALSKLLQANKVIDRNFNWIFGNGHLVFAGDMVDRGEQVTECLWLIYSLEEKAQATGGKVHFILGNHEIMNLQGDEHYVRSKYKNAYKLMGKTLAEMYGENSELGRWLRSKNIIEKIGDNLFCHAGISRALNQANLNLEQINQLARPYYDERRKDYGNADLNTILSTQLGPFWYRGYYVEKYKEDRQESIIDSTLHKFEVTRIITGHSIVADTISVHYDGKVINTDTEHADGHSEALLIENGRYCRVKDTGEKKLLFRKNHEALAGKSNNSSVTSRK